MSDFFIRILESLFEGIGEVTAEFALNKAFEKERQEQCFVTQQSVSLSLDLDYGKLRSFLVAKNWEDASWETIHIFREIIKQLRAYPQDLTYLHASGRDFEKIPCQDLYIIDRLWVVNSQGKYGLSIQANIWKSIGGPRDFVDRYPIYDEFDEITGRNRCSVWSDEADRYIAAQQHIWKNGYYPDTLGIGGIGSLGNILFRAEICGLCEWIKSFSS